MNDSILESLRKLWSHAAWADARMLAALRNHTHMTEAWREYAHVLGAEAVWLARMEGRDSPVPVWPDLTIEQVTALRIEVVDGYERLLATATNAQLHADLAYKTSAGQPFTNSVRDILMHVMLHGQYHRGKINALLRQADAEPAPADYITFVRETALRPAAQPSRLM